MEPFCVSLLSTGSHRKGGPDGSQHLPLRTKQVWEIFSAEGRRCTVLHTGNPPSRTWPSGKVSECGALSRMCACSFARSLQLLHVWDRREVQERLQAFQHALERESHAFWTSSGEKKKWRLWVRAWLWKPAQSHTGGCWLGHVTLRKYSEHLDPRSQALEAPKTYDCAVCLCIHCVSSLPSRPSQCVQMVRRIKPKGRNPLCYNMRREVCHTLKMCAQFRALGIKGVCIFISPSQFYSNSALDVQHSIQFPSFVGPTLVASFFRGEKVNPNILLCVEPASFLPGRNSPPLKPLLSSHRAVASPVGWGLLHPEPNAAMSTLSLPTAGERPSFPVWSALTPALSIPHTRPPSRVTSSQALASTLFQRPPGGCSLEESIQDYFYRERNKDGSGGKKRRARREHSGRKGERWPEGKAEGRGIPPVYFYRYTSPIKI